MNGTHVGKFKTPWKSVRVNFITSTLRALRTKKHQSRTQQRSSASMLTELECDAEKMSFLWTIDKSNSHSIHLEWGGNLCETLFRCSKPWPHIRMRRNEHVNDTKHTCTRLMVSSDRVVFAVHIDLLAVWLLFGIVVAAINRLIVVCGALCSLITAIAREGQRGRKNGQINLKQHRIRKLLLESAKLGQMQSGPLLLSAKRNEHIDVSLIGSIFFLNIWPIVVWHQIEREYHSHFRRTTNGRWLQRWPKWLVQVDK